MTRPMSEPSPTQRTAESAYAIRQLQRRPAAGGYGLSWCRAVWAGETVAAGGDYVPNVTAPTSFETNDESYFGVGPNNGVTISRVETVIGIWAGATLDSIVRAGTHYIELTWVSTSPTMTFGRGAQLVTADDSTLDPLEVSLFDFGVGHSSGMHEVAPRYVRIGGSASQVVASVQLVVVRFAQKNFTPDGNPV
jgi:hypothetical protein